MAGGAWARWRHMHRMGAICPRSQFRAPPISHFFPNNNVGYSDRSEKLKKKLAIVGTVLIHIKRISWFFCVKGSTHRPWS